MTPEATARLIDPNNTLWYLEVHGDDWARIYNLRAKVNSHLATLMRRKTTQPPEIATVLQREKAIEARVNERVKVIT
jgi:hypothetical protein